MVGQVNGEFEVKEPLLQRYYHAAKNNIARFNKAPLEHTPRENNKRADILSKLSVTKKKSHQRSVIQIWMTHPSVSEIECLAIDEVEAETNNWMTPIIQYLNHLVFEGQHMQARARKSNETIVCLVHHDQ